MLTPKVNASGREGLDENFAGASLEFNSRDAARAFRRYRTENPITGPARDGMKRGFRGAHFADRLRRFYSSRYSS